MCRQGVLVWGLPAGSWERSRGLGVYRRGWEGTAWGRGVRREGSQAGKGEGPVQGSGCHVEG